MEQYKYNFMDSASRLMDLKGKKILEIGCGRGDLLKEIARVYRPQYIIGIDNDFGFWDTGPGKRDNWEMAEGDATRLDFPDNFFDVALSVGTLEHLKQLKDFFSEIRRVLKPGGKFFTEFSPIWTSVIGHHYNFWIEKDVGIIPPWGHLWMDEKDLCRHLEPVIGLDRANKACYEIFRSSQINRLTRKQYYGEVLDSGLWVRELKEICSFSGGAFLGKNDFHLTKEIYQKLKDKYSPHDLSVLGFTMLLEKHHFF